MNWTAALGLAVLLISMGILASFLPNWWPDNSLPRRSATDEPRALDSLIREHLDRRGARTKRLAAIWSGILLLLSILLILQSQYPSYQAPPFRPVQVIVTPFGNALPPIVIGPVVDPTTPAPGTAGSGWVVISFMALFSAALLAGGVYLIARKSIPKRAAGAALIALGTLSSHVSLVHEFKLEIGPLLRFESQSRAQIEAIVDEKINAKKAPLIRGIMNEVVALIEPKLNFEATLNTKIAAIKTSIFTDLKGESEVLIKQTNVNIDEAWLQAKFETYFGKIGALGPEHLQDFVGFPLGSKELTAEMKKLMPVVCDRWNKRTEYQDGFLLAVGATDRIPLGASAQATYESNFGLARARAERVKAAIVDECSIPPERTLAMVSGPRTTPDPTSQPANNSGYPEDRMVDVWAIWTLRSRR